MPKSAGSAKPPDFCRTRASIRASIRALPGLLWLLAWKADGNWSRLREIAGNRWRLLDIAGRCWTLLDVAGQCWTLLDVAG